MMRSLYTGVSGLKTHQTKMDVIGNNIANVNTVAYKSASITFNDLMYQTTQKASGPNASTGTAGTNARQIGLGVKSGAIYNNIATEGATQSTGNPWDVKITGDAFFVVNNGTNNYFTRDGSFYVDGAGNLAMRSTGYNVMGWQPDPANPDIIKEDTVSALRIMSAANMTYDPEATTESYISGTLDRNDEQVGTDSGKTINMSLYDGHGYKYTAKYSVYNYSLGAGTPPVKTALPDGQYRVALQDIQDENGKSLVAAGANLATVAGISINGTAAANAEFYIQMNTKEGKIAGLGATSGDATAQYTAGATVANPVQNFTLDFNAGNASLLQFSDINVDMSTVKWFNNGGTSTLAATPGDLENGVGAGRKAGKMSEISIADDGTITAKYDNGMNRLLGQIAVATFANASGLEKAGDNLYSATLNSGEFDGTGKNIKADGDGYMSTGVLEMSNVDLSSEFTEMITTQRGFQANSRIITVSDTMLEELVNLKR